MPIHTDDKTVRRTASDLPAGWVSLRCSHEGCKRRRPTRLDDTMPAGTAIIRSPCPDHTPHGGFSDEQYFDADGKELFHK
jgi:hypothetical protein